MGHLRAHLPTPPRMFSCFLPKMAQAPCLTLPIHPILPLSNFLFVSWMKIILKEKHFADVKEMKQKITEALKGIKIDKFKNCLNSRKCLDRCTASNGEYFEDD